MYGVTIEKDRRRYEKLLPIAERKAGMSLIKENEVKFFQKMDSEHLPDGRVAYKLFRRLHFYVLHITQKGHK